MSEIIVEEIRNQGVISFARFMELALYCPVYGYYEKEADTIGRRGDYYTSVSVGPLFGQLLACQFADWLEIQGPKSTAEIRMVEAGAHQGDLARDILDWLRQQRPALLERLEYWIVEPSARRRGWQEQTVREFAGKVRWVEDLAGLRSEPDRGAGAAQSSEGLTIFFSNELLDAFPVHRLGWDAREQSWFEWGVTFRNERFEFNRVAGRPLVSRLTPLATVPHLNGLPRLPRSLNEALPDGFVLEVGPTAFEWWQQAAAVLAWGKLITIDYGLTTEEFLRPERRDGTLRAYHRHQVRSDLLACPGEQDITAHVDFAALQAAGEAAGLRTEALSTQPQFLTQIAGRIWNGEFKFGEWTPRHTRQFQTLTHPEHLGRGFRVLVQGATGPTGPQ